MQEFGADLSSVGLSCCFGKNRNVELVKWQKGLKRLRKKENIHTLDSPQTLPVTFPAAFQMFPPEEIQPLERVLL